jgi:D-aspartate ligase
MLHNRFTADKAWLAATCRELYARYREARALVPADLVLVQEMIPGGGDCQFSYAALVLQGRPIAAVTARRTRQYRIDFGHSSCLVETMDVPEVVDSSRRVLGALAWTGLVEIEFKRDPRNGQYKLLDINPRLWTWSPLCSRAV